MNLQEIKKKSFFGWNTRQKEKDNDKKSTKKDAYLAGWNAASEYIASQLAEGFRKMIGKDEE